MNALIDFIVTVPARVLTGAGWLLEHPVTAAGPLMAIVAVAGSVALHVVAGRRRSGRFSGR